MAAMKRSHNKKHLCVSCGEVRGKFHSHVISCRGASKESASDLLSQELARVDSLRLARFSIHELESEFGKTWPMHAYAYLKVGIPIKISDKKALSSVKDLMSYFDIRKLGKFVRTVESVLTFQWNDASIASSQPQVSDNALTSKAHIHSASTVLERDQGFASQSASSSQPQVSDNASGLNACLHSASPVLGQDQALAPHNVISQTQVSDNNLGLDANMHLGPTYEQDYMFVATPLEKEMQYEESQNIGDNFNDNDIDKKSNSPVKVTRKRKRVIMLSPESDTSPRSTVRMPDASPPCVTRFKSGRKTVTKAYVETEVDGYLIADDDVNDPSYEPEMVGLNARRSKLKAAMVKKLNTGMSDSDTSISDSDAESTCSRSNITSHKNATSSKRQVISKKMKEVGLQISKTALSDALDCNEHVKNYTCYMRVRNYSVKHTETTGKNMLRTMQFFSDDKNLDNYDPQNLLDMAKRYDFYEALKSVGLASDTVNKYCLALTTMVQYESTNASNPSEIRELFKLANARCVDETKGLKSRYTSTTKARRREFENSPADYSKTLSDNNSNYDHLKNKAETILNSTSKTLPDPKDLRTVNMFFYAHFLRYGQRPSAFENMPFDEIKQSKTRYQNELNLGIENAARYLATDEHKTGNVFIARVPFYEVDSTWQMLLLYKKKLRPVPANDEGKKRLFLNSKGKPIKTASSDYFDICEQENLPAISSTKVRHAIETFCHNKFTDREQGWVAGVLSHSLKTAKRVYVDDRKQEFYDGINALNAMYKQVCGSGETANITPVSSYDSQPVETVSSVSIRLNVPELTPSTSQTIPSGYECILPGNSNRSESPALSCSSSSSDTLHGTKAENRKKIIDMFWPNIQADTVTPSSDEYTRLVEENSRFGLGVSISDRKSFQDAFLQLVVKKRAADMVDLVGRENLTDPDSKFTSLLTKRNWFSKRCLSACIKMYEEKYAKKRRLRQESQNLIKDPTILQAIEKQEWPAITQFSSNVKGKGIKAKCDIESGTVICDYHGELLTSKEGDKKYIENESEQNVYMYKFGFRGDSYYIDANEKHCKCHPGKFLKGRLLNHSKLKQNVKPVVHHLENGTPVILFIATKKIKARDEICYDYGAKEDRKSATLDWMSS